jgi:hypothetical protein
VTEFLGTAAHPEIAIGDPAAAHCRCSKQSTPPGVHIPRHGWPIPPPVPPVLLVREIFSWKKPRSIVRAFVGATSRRGGVRRLLDPMIPFCRLTYR